MLFFPNKDIFPPISILIPLKTDSFYKVFINTDLKRKSIFCTKMNEDDDSIGKKVSIHPDFRWFHEP